MKLETARQLIEDGIEDNRTRQVWADLGAGNGLFTYALSAFLNDDSLMYAIDKDSQGLSGVAIRKPVKLEKIYADFVHGNWKTEPLNGIMMANSLHFVKDKEAFLKKIKQRLQPDGRLVIVEYEMDRGNTWVPYPVSFNKLKEIAASCGFSFVKKMKEVPSVYDGRMIYSAVVNHIGT